MPDEQYRAAFERASIGLALVAPDGRWLRVNPAFCQLLGYTETELLASDFPAIAEAGDPDSAIGDVRALLAGAAESFEQEKRYQQRDGRALRVLLSVMLVRDEGGGPRYFIAQAQDITVRKQAEELLAAYSAQLERSNRELQEFAAVASHDLQEPLRKIQAFGDRLATKHGAALPDEGRDYLARMQQAAGRMRTLIDNLLTYARVETTAQPCVPVDLGRVAREVLADLEARVAETGARVELGALPTIEADPSQMRQLLQNLIGNALKFHQPGVAPVVSVAACVDVATDGGGAARCHLTVADHGIGFAEQHRERIFAIFERLHGRGEYAGTGIGLAICRRIVERHGGSIAATSAPGAGATFTVTLPLTQPIVPPLGVTR